MNIENISDYKKAKENFCAKFRSKDSDSNLEIVTKDISLLLGMYFNCVNPDGNSVFFVRSNTRNDMLEGTEYQYVGSPLKVLPNKKQKEKEFLNIMLVNILQDMVDIKNSLSEEGFGDVINKLVTDKGKKTTDEDISEFIRDIYKMEVDMEEYNNG